MKKWFLQIAVLCALGLSISACEKDEDRVTMSVGAEPGLTASATTANLNIADADKMAVTYSWEAPDFGFSAAPTYTLEFAKRGTNFAAPHEVSGFTGRTKSFTVKELNSILISQLRLPAGNAAQVDVRMKASLNRDVFVYSPVQTLNVTPYLVIIDYPSLFVPGNHQSWTPASAPKVSAFGAAPTSYEGYVNLSAASPEFKFTNQRNWDGINYGLGSAAGTLSTNGAAGNLTAPSAGYYRLRANTAALTWEATKTTWSVIGSSTPGGWNTDTPMTFDASTGKWSVRVALKAGADNKIKFRANSDWDINFGDGSATIPADGILEYGGGDIIVPAAGTYTVTLDLSNPGNYSYSLVP